MILESELRIEVVWADYDFFEIAVKASNGFFSGFTEVYTQAKQMLSFADALQNFPQQTSDILTLELGDGYPVLGLKVFCTDGLGHTAIRINIKENSRNNYNPEEKSSALFYLPCFPEQLRRFGQQIVKMTKNKQGAASL